ncbi:MAG: hypothetical protein K2X38_12495, partial [Gemmataceae bacterium]|nr:hypothetical protein [Gemmataceae bacterium]
EAILFVLRTGCQWKALDATRFCPGSAEMRKRGSVDKAKLRERLDKHKTDDDVKKQAAAAFGALHHHHGDLVVHRIEELADATEKSLAAIPEEQTDSLARKTLVRKLAALRLMMDHAEAKGVTGIVRERKKLRKSPNQKTSGVTIAREISSRGGIDPASLEEFVGKGKIGEEGLLGIARKGGMSVDEFAQTLEKEGHFVTPPGRNADDYLVELIQRGAHSMVNAANHLEKQLEAEYAEYIKQAEDAAIERADIEERRRIGEEAGGSEEIQGDAWEGPGSAVGEAGLDFDPSTFDDPEPTTDAEADASASSAAPAQTAEADVKPAEAQKNDPSTTAFFTPPPVQGNLLNDNGGEWVKPLTSGEKAKPLYTANSDTPTRTKDEIDGKSAIQRSMEEKERAAESSMGNGGSEPPKETGTDGGDGWSGIQPGQLVKHSGSTYEVTKVNPPSKKHKLGTIEGREAGKGYQTPRILGGIADLQKGGAQLVTADSHKAEKESAEKAKADAIQAKKDAEKAADQAKAEAEKAERERRKGLSLEAKAAEMQADPAAWGYKRKHIPSGKLPENGRIDEWRRDPNETYSKGQVHKGSDGYRTVVSVGDPITQGDAEWGSVGWSQVVMTRPSTPQEGQMALVGRRARRRLLCRVRLGSHADQAGWSQPESLCT